MSFEAEIPIRFGDVDWARIVYYPRFFHLLHVAFEELFERHVGIAYSDLVEKHNLGFPSVRVETDFMKPLRFGELMRVRFEVPRIGRSSVDFDHIVFVAPDPEPRARARLVRVAVDMRSLRPVAVPDAIRAKLLELGPARPVPHRVGEP